MECLTATRKPGFQFPRDEEHEPEPARQSRKGRLAADLHRLQLKRAVAALSNAAVAEMNRRELVFAVRTAELPWLDGDDHWQQSDRATLERLVYLARETCRTQLSDLHSDGRLCRAGDVPLPRRPAR